MRASDVAPVRDLDQCIIPLNLTFHWREAALQVKLISYSIHEY